MKSIIKVLISALLILSITVLPVAAVDSESTDTAWMEKLSARSLELYEAMSDDELVDLWLILAPTGMVSTTSLNGPNDYDYYEENFSFLEKYVPEERKATAYVLRLTRSVLVDGTKAEIEYYARLDEVDQVVIEEEIEITNWPDTPPSPVNYLFQVVTTVVQVKDFFGESVTVTDLGGNVLPNDAVVGSGCRINNFHTISIKGDVNGDGVVSAIDYLGLTASVASGKTLDNAFALAVDFNADGTITAADCLMMKDLLRK